MMLSVVATAVASNKKPRGLIGATKVGKLEICSPRTKVNRSEHNINETSPTDFPKKIRSEPEISD